MNEEFNKFIEDIKQDTPATIDEALGIKPPEPKQEDTAELPEKAEEPRKNRHHRRLEQQLQQEREARIRAEAIAEARAERMIAETGEVDPRLLQLYGSEERGKEAAALHQQILRDMAQQARDEAMKEFESRQQAREAEVKQFEAFVDNGLENLEETYNVDLTSNAPAARKARTEFLSLLEQISPKDGSGNIKEYADFNGTFEVYQAKRQAERDTSTSDRQKDLAARTMAKTGAAPETPKQPTPGFRGWMRDYGI